MDIDVIIEVRTWQDREAFPYESFRESLADIGVYVDDIRFVQ